MKYLKLFEDHKETSDKISEIERLAKEQSDEVINQYKELIDEVMYDVSDDYKTESKINVNYDSISDCKTYLEYRIYFTGDKYEDLLSKLLEVVRDTKHLYKSKEDSLRRTFGIRNISDILISCIYNFVNQCF
jgi:uncharacterized protein YaaR (DUF327 family)